MLAQINFFYIETSINSQESISKQMNLWNWKKFSEFRISLWEPQRKEVWRDESLKFGSRSNWGSHNVQKEEKKLQWNRFCFEVSLLSKIWIAVIQGDQHTHNKKQTLNNVLIKLRIWVATFVWSPNVFYEVHIYLSIFLKFC